jgi:hypothetical protein
LDACAEALRLGIAIERIKPGRPQQNGRHERMHLTLKTETTRPAGLNSLQQQARFDAFRQEFNTERPHEALQMRCPAEVYSDSTTPTIYAGVAGRCAIVLIGNGATPSWPISSLAPALVTVSVKVEKASKSGT